jgi:hypothetical protein
MLVRPDAWWTARGSAASCMANDGLRWRRSFGAASGQSIARVLRLACFGGRR